MSEPADHPARIRFLDHFLRASSTPAKRPAHRVEAVSPATIPDEVAHARELPEEIRRIHPGPLTRYDYKTIFYDVFHDGRRVVLSGPPLMNLKPAVEAAKWRLDGRPLLFRPRLKDVTRAQDSALRCLSRPRELRLTFDGWQARCPVRSADRTTFAGRRVLLTASKDNPLTWIADWAHFYHQYHGVDAVLLYDNGSDYPPEDVLETLARVTGIAAAVVVVWPFKFGPNREAPGVTAHGDYSQKTMFDHARRRFLSSSDGFLNVDVDELLICHDGSTVFDHLAEQPSGVLRFAGEWIESVGTPETGLQRFRDFGYVLKADDPDYAPTSSKWAIDPRRIARDTVLRTHSVKGLDGPVRLSPGLSLLHFKGISTNWKVDRHRPKQFDPTRHVPHEEWIAIRDRIF